MPDFFNDILNRNTWQWGLVAFVVLLFLYFTDVRLSFLNFIIRVLRSKDINEVSEGRTLWTKLPTNPQKIPVAGLIEKFIARKKLKKYNNYFVENRISKVSWLYGKFTKTNELPHTDADLLKLKYNEFASRNGVNISMKEVAIISGKPGSGKTTFVLNELMKKIKVHKQDFIIYFPFSKFKQCASFNNLNLKEFNESFWNDIAQSFSQNELLKFIKPTPNLISYLINYCYCVFIIDDVVGYENLEKIRDSFYNYIITCHRRNSNLKIIITTREQRLNDRIDNSFTGITTLNPLSKADAEGFFYEKCDLLQATNSLVFSDIVSAKPKLLKFEDEYTQTPLFIELVAYMISVGKFKELSEVLQKSVAAVYGEFIKILYGENLPGLTYEQFLSKYRLLAFNITEQNKPKFYINDIQTVFTNNEVNADFLNSKGLLIRDETRYSYSFIHQTVSDILYIDEIVNSNKFSLFIGVIDIGEEYMYYLREKIETPAQVISLLKANLLIANIVVNDTLLNKMPQVSIDAQRVFDEAFDYFFGNSTQTDEILLSDFLNKYLKYINVNNYLCNRISGINGLSQKNIKYAAAFNVGNVNQYLLNQLIGGNNVSDFATLIINNNPSVANLIDSALILENRNTALQNQLLLFLLSPKVSNQMCKKYSDWFIKNINSFSQSTLEILLSIRDIRKNVLFENYINIDIRITKIINKALFTVYPNAVYIPTGSYQVNGKIIKNSDSILIPKRPTEILIHAENIYKAEMKALNNIHFKLMTFEQLQIANSNFAKTTAIDLEGIITLFDQNIVNQGILYEAYKNNSIGELRFAFNETKQTGLMKRNTTYDDSFLQNIIYRRILPLE